MTAWQRLGIEPTDNQREIKKAYAKQLKLIDQDTQPEEFILLREAWLCCIKPLKVKFS
ncbi:UNVERIFIED_CONTAM: hypothetical protein KWF34_16690 [Acinetobacter baumannii]